MREMSGRKEKDRVQGIYLDYVVLAISRPISSRESVYRHPSLCLHSPRLDETHIRPAKRITKSRNNDPNGNISILIRARIHTATNPKTRNRQTSHVQHTCIQLSKEQGRHDFSNGRILRTRLPRYIPHISDMHSNQCKYKTSHKHTTPRQTSALTLRKGPVLRDTTTS